MTIPRLPTVQIPVVDENSRMTQAWYRALDDAITQLQGATNQATALLNQLIALQKTVKGIPKVTFWGAIAGDIPDQDDLQTALNAKAPIDSPAFTTAVGFNGTGAIPKQNVTGAWAGNVAGKNLTIALAATGLITDSTTA